MKALAIVMLVIGIAAVGLGVAVIVLASPAGVRCNAQTCEWHQSGLFGGSRVVTYPTAQLHDSRTEYDTHRTGITTRWVVSAPQGTLELAATDRDEDAAFYEGLAKQMQDFLRQPKDRAFEAFFPGTNRHPWIVLAIFGALALAGGIYLMRA